MKYFSRNLLLLTALGAGFCFSLARLGAAPAGDMEGLFEERIRSVVAVEFFVETEIDRQPSAELGIVADEEGLIILPEHAVPGWVPVEQLKEFKVHPLRSRTDFEAEYLGQETLNGWHFLRVKNADFHDVVTPVTAYEVAEPHMGQELWGIAVMDDDFDFEPYYLAGRFSLLRKLPQNIGFTMAPVASPGSLVFDMDGGLIGWAGLSYLTDALLHLGEERIPVAIQGLRESGAFYPATEFLPHLDRVPEDPEKRVVPWIGVSSLQPVEREVAEFLGIVDQSGVVLSEIIEKSPGAEAGLEKGDVVVAINGEAIPYYRPHRAATQHLQREVLKRQPGEVVRFTVLRGTEEREYEIKIEPQPATLREARRHYFADIGITLREFLLFDGVARRTGTERDQGLIVQFVRPNSPAGAAGLQVGDWIKEVDGAVAAAYEEAVELVSEAEEAERGEVVFLVSRQNETSVVRVQLR